jgi:hypothetical protein
MVESRLADAQEGTQPDLAPAPEVSPKPSPMAGSR